MSLGDNCCWCAALCVTASVWAQWARGIIIVGVQGSSFLVEVGLTCFLLLLSSVNILNLPQFARGLAETLRNFPPDFPIFSSELFSSLEATLHHQCVRVEITACQVCAETLWNVPPDFPIFFPESCRWVIIFSRSHSTSSNVLGQESQHAEFILPELLAGIVFSGWALSITLISC